MRPLKLTLQSFGPFAGEQTVDFTRYGDNAFLLIHGPTGSGKTTILDGICYALYGDASGENREDRYLRSQQAAQTSLCEVSFLFQVGPRRFYIKRIPPQSVEQKGALREIKHRVELCQVDDEGAVIGERLSKVGDVQKQVEEVLGFTSEQFRQVVVLPQGEFRKLLFAKSDEKEHILEKLFGTGRFKLVEHSLKARRASISGELKELKAAVEGILSSHRVTSTSELEERIVTLADRRHAQVAERELQLKHQLQLDKQLQDAQALNQRFIELDQARATHGPLSADKKDKEQLAQQLELATRALHLVDLELVISKATKGLSERKRELSSLVQTIATLSERQQSDRQQVHQSRSTADQIPAMTAEKTRLEHQLLKLQELELGKTKLARAEQDELAARTSFEKRISTLAATEERVASCTTQIESLFPSNGTIVQLQAEAGQLAIVQASRNQLETDLASLDHLAKELQSVTQTVATEENRLAEVQIQHQDLLLRFTVAQAAVLARKLADRTPCPVCGSLDHPCPAEAVDDVPTDRELEAARKLVTTVTATLQAAMTKQADVQARHSGIAAGIAKLQTQLGEHALQSLAVLSEHKELILQQLAQAQTDATKLEQARQERTRLQAILVQDKHQLSLAEAALTVTTAGLEGQRAVIDSLAHDAGTGSVATVTQLINELTERCNSAQGSLQKAEAALAATDEQLAAALGQQGEKQTLIIRLEAETADQKEAFGIRLQSEGFSSEHAWQEALMPRHEIAVKNSEIEQFSRSLAAAQERLARAEGATAGYDRPDLATLTTNKLQADERLGALQKEVGGLEAEHAGLQAALASVDDTLRRISQLEQTFAVTGRLADLTGGQNPKKMTLQRYVLAALFEEVAIAASQRLARMSRGRYHLVRSEIPKDLKSASGLDLDVTDDHTGEKRPAFTLSGGESFLASLSLALGLSDVVMAQSGGRYLDCIFIDEGFGSLDSETLDFALNTLIDLHRSGRVIGIISHVAELKERILSRIEVVSSKDGSRIIQETR